MLNHITGLVCLSLCLYVL